MIRTAVIGIGNMGSKYASLLQSGSIEYLELSAVTRIKESYSNLLRPSTESGIPVFENAEELFKAVESKDLKLDAVINSHTSLLP